MIGKSLEYFEITSDIGTGGMGEVNQAMGRKLGTEVPIKILSKALTPDDDCYARLQHEAILSAFLNQPDIDAIDAHEETDRYKQPGASPF